MNLLFLSYMYSARALQSLYRSGKESENKWVFNLDLKDDIDDGCDDDITSASRLLHVFAAFAVNYLGLYFKHILM